jgi:putative glutathione S-transferase
MNLLQLCSSNATTTKTALSSDFLLISLIDNPRQASRGGWILNATDKNIVNPNWKDLRDVYNYYYRNKNDMQSDGQLDDTTSNSEYVGRCTAPLLVDTYSRTLISNESSDIVQLLIQYYNTYCRKIQDQPQESPIEYCYTNLYPDELRDHIDSTTRWVYEKLNNGVYRCGFATSQLAYNQACCDVREALQQCNDILSQSTFLCSNTTLTVADIYLLPTLLRFDGVYSPLFKAGGTHTSLRSYEYRHIQRYIKQCWNTIPGVRESINLTKACASYYEQLFPLNPSNIIPYPITAYDLGLVE